MTEIWQSCVYVWIIPSGNRLTFTCMTHSETAVIISVTATSALPLGLNRSANTLIDSLNRYNRLIDSQPFTSANMNQRHSVKSKNCSPSLANCLMITRQKPMTSILTSCFRRYGQCTSLHSLDENTSSNHNLTTPNKVSSPVFKTTCDKSSLPLVQQSSFQKVLLISPHRKLNWCAWHGK